MTKMIKSNYLGNWKKNALASYLLFVFFVVSIIEMIAEYNANKLLIWLTKPLILPLLTLYYLRRSKRINVPFIVALLFSWIANMIFIQNTFQLIVLGVFFFLIYRVLIIYIVVNKVNMPNSIPLVIGSLPFIFIYLSVTFFTYDTLGKNVYLFLIQGVFTIFLGGFSLGNYIMLSNKSNTLLFLSTILMSFNQFVFLMKFYYGEANLFQAFAMVLFVFGQFLLTKYMLHTEKKKYKYEITNSLTENS